MLSTAQAWDILRRVPDPEIPVISVIELGIVRDVRAADDVVDVVVTPTYSGCPATEAIETSIREALVAAGAARVHVTRQLAPPWTTDWIEPDAQQKLRAYGIAPPGRIVADTAMRLHFVPRVACPLCGSDDTERLSQFGATACKALYRCRACLEPFEFFKPL